MTAIEYRIFDDLLIANFMKTTLHGEWPETKRYPEFSLAVPKYAHNGNARTEAEIAAYLKAYERRGSHWSFGHAVRVIEETSKSVVRAVVPRESPAYGTLARSYRTIKARLRSKS